MAVNAPDGERRTQAERSAAMRQRLLDATVECLVTHGYGGTTTHRVAEVAGVTRGAQIHHFGSKHDLVSAAIEHLAEQRARAAIAELGRIEHSDDVPTAILEFLWDIHQGPLTVATFELWIASRTDPVLAHQVQRVEPVVNGAVLAAIAKVLPERATAQKELRYAVYTAMDALRGIFVGSFPDGDPARLRRRWDRAATQLRRDIAAALTEAARTSA
jgi:AcrR family transcriptional regulator